MIGIVVRDLPYLKLLHPICEQFIEMKVPYIIYHMDCYRGEKQYNNASLVNLKKSSPSVVSGAKKVKAFANDKQLLAQLKHDRISKMVSVEIWLWAKSYLKALKNIKLYSMLYLTDSIWQDAPSITTMDRVYYASAHTMEIHQEFAGLTCDSKRDRCIGSPIFDPLATRSAGDDILVLLPNLRANHVKSAFGDKDRFVKIIEKLSHGGDLIFKTRQKQWLPDEIKPYAKEIVNDGDVMYPPVVAKLFNQCQTTVMFYSSGLYEAVYAGNYVVNIPLPIKRWGWSQKKLGKYFSTQPKNLYQFDGVVESVDQSRVLGNWTFKPRRIDNEQRRHWVSRYIGYNTDCSAARIAKDVVNG